MARGAVKSGYQLVALALIDPPALAMRESMDPQGLEELADSIKRLGVLMPLILSPRGKRYEIEDGHRRYIAAGRAGLKEVPAIVRSSNGVSGEAVKCHANWFRESVNPAEEAGYLAELLQRDCAGDVDALCKLIGQTRSYVEGRLLLFQGDEEVFAALKRGAISMAVARELNRIEDVGYRRMYLDAAIKGGATARMVSDWRQACAAVAPIEAPATGDGTNQHTGVPAPVTSMVCLCCGQTDRPWDLELLYLCRSGCRQIVERLLGRQAGGE